MSYEEPEKVRKIDDDELELATGGGAVDPFDEINNQIDHVGTKPGGGYNALIQGLDEPKTQSPSGDSGSSGGGGTGDNEGPG